MRIIISLLAAVILAGCASTQRAPVVDGRIQAPEGKSVIVLSITADTYNPDTADAAVTITGPGGASINAYTQLLGDLITSPPGSDNVRGKVYTFAVAPGDYALTRAIGTWNLTSGVAGESGGTAQVSNIPLNMPFSLQPGQVVYIGQTKMNLNFQATAEFSDQHVRDFYDLQKRQGVTDFSNVILKPFSGSTTFKK